MIKSILTILVLAPSLTFAATKTATKKTAKSASTQVSTQKEETAVTETSQAPTQQNTMNSGNVANFNMNDLKGFSIFGAYDLNDKVTMSEGPNGTVDKTFILGGLYQFEQFEPGTAIQVGGTYEFERKVKNSDLKLSMNTAFAEADLRFSPKVSINGGLNYSFPSLSGAQGVSISGKIGYQVGASYAAKNKFSIDAKYRIVSTEVSQDGVNKSVDADLKGLAVYGRYNF